MGIFCKSQKARQTPSFLSIVIENRINYQVKQLLYPVLLAVEIEIAEKALKPGGILFVGATEAILNFRKLGYTSFQPFFYQKPLT